MLSFASHQTGEPNTRRGGPTPKYIVSPAFLNLRRLRTRTRSTKELRNAVRLLLAAHARLTWLQDARRSDRDITPLAEKSNWLRVAYGLQAASFVQPRFHSARR
jgi:hypothetical protein